MNKGGAYLMIEARRGRQNQAGKGNYQGRVVMPSSQTPLPVSKRPESQANRMKTTMKPPGPANCGSKRIKENRK